MHLPIDILLLLYLGPCLIRNPSFFNLFWSQKTCIVVQKASYSGYLILEFSLGHVRVVWLQWIVCTNFCLIWYRIAFNLLCLLHCVCFLFSVFYSQSCASGPVSSVGWDRLSPSGEDSAIQGSSPNPDHP